jgi:hypothetical protein
VRQRGVEELMSLKEAGYVIDICDRRLPTEEYLARCAGARIVWSFEGLGWPTFRQHQAAPCRYSLGPQSNCTDRSWMGFMPSIMTLSHVACVALYRLSSRIEIGYASSEWQPATTFSRITHPLR